MAAPEKVPQCAVTLIGWPETLWISNLYPALSDTPKSTPVMTKVA